MAKYKQKFCRRGFLRQKFAIFIAKGSKLFFKICNFLQKMPSIDKLEIKNKVGLVIFAIKNGIVHI
jgi:hypothetical protein